MEALSLVPAADAIPAPWWLFETLLITALSAHFILINIVVGGSILAIGSRIASKRPRTVTFEVPGITTALALGINFGVAPLLFAQVLYGHLLYTSSILMAAWWILVIPVLIIAYYGAYIHTGGGGETLRAAALAVSVIALVYIAFIFVNNMTLMLHPRSWTAYFENRSGTLLNLSDPTLIPRYIHFLVASVAVAGLYGALRAHRSGKAESAPAVRKGLRIFAFATIIQIAGGLWFLLSLPAETMRLFLGGNYLYTLVIALGVILTVVSISFALRGRVIPATVSLAAIVVLMVINRANLRSAFLGEFFRPADLRLEPQYGVMALFLLAVVGMAYAVRRMIAMLPVSGEGRDGR